MRIKVLADVTVEEHPQSPGRRPPPPYHAAALAPHPI